MARTGIDHTTLQRCVATATGDGNKCGQSRDMAHTSMSTHSAFTPPEGQNLKNTKKPGGAVVAAAAVCPRVSALRRAFALYPESRISKEKETSIIVFVLILFPHSAKHNFEWRVAQWAVAITFEFPLIG